MNLKNINKLIEKKDFLEKRINFYLKKKLLIKQKPEKEEIKGHLEKSEHNLNFVFDNLKIGYLDWCVVGCYYALYHSALSLIINKGFNSKSHEATLCILIKEYYKKGINKEDIKTINNSYLEYQDILFYVNSKNKREEANYSSKNKFDLKEVQNLHKTTIEFVNKVKEILENE